MTSESITAKPTYEDFKSEWLTGIEEITDPLEKGRQFAAKLITQWLNVTTDDDDFFICDGSHDGGIDIAYLSRSDTDSRNGDSDDADGDIWYIIQSKYGTAYEGVETVREEGSKVINTIMGRNQQLADDSRQVRDKIETFRQQATPFDRLILVLATVDPITETDRAALEDVKILGREHVGSLFDVEEVSIRTIYESLDANQPQALSIPLDGHFVNVADILVGASSLVDLFNFLKSYRQSTGNLDQLYDKNVRRFLAKSKINKNIATTLADSPEKFGLYNNGITIVASNYRLDASGLQVILNDPYIVNGCQTTRTIWNVLDRKLNAGGTGSSPEVEQWYGQAQNGRVVTKIVRSDQASIADITRYTNSQNGVRQQDFIALEGDFPAWAKSMGEEHGIFLEVQRGGIDSRKSFEKQHPDQPKFADYVNAFDLIKAYGAGWLGQPGTAFGKNAPFLPGGSIYKEMISRSEDDRAFGVRDFCAAYQLKRAADRIGFGRGADRPSRRLSRFLFYYIWVELLKRVIVMTPAIHKARYPLAKSPMLYWTYQRQLLRMGYQNFPK